MRGLFVVGTSTAAREGVVAAALCESLRAAGEEPSAYAVALTGAAGRSDAALLARAARAEPAEVAPNVWEQSASPMIAGRHEGASIDPGELPARVRAAADGGPLVACTGGGLLAQLTPRYAVRDLAGELGLPVVVAVAPSPDAVNHVRLTAAATRGAGLPLAAVVLSAWPDDPGRVLLDERRALEELADVPVLALPARAAIEPEALEREAASWPVADWLEAAPTAPGDSVAAARVELEPYTAWEAHPVGDPRQTPRPRIMEVMQEIVAAEGPMTATRAYSLYNKASGGKKLTSVARAPLSSSVYWLAQERKLVLVKKDEIPWQDDDVIRLPDTPAVRVRELGPRALEEVPLDEIAELVRRLRASRRLNDAMETKRAVLSTYGLVRLTTKADEYLNLALDLAE